MKCNCRRGGAGVYGVAHKIDFILGDFTQVLSP